jgi:hypothetical protein
MLGISRARIALAFCAGAILSSAATADSIYLGDLTPAEKTDVSLWGSLFWQRVDQGGGNVGAGFSFSTAAMNGHLFNPLRSTRRTLELVNEIHSTDCDVLGPTLTDIGNMNESARAAFRTAMINGSIVTDSVTNPEGTFEHAMLIVSADPEAGIQVVISGSLLISTGLPLAPAEDMPTDPTLHFSIGATSQQAIASLLNAGPQWVIDSGAVTEAQKLLTGAASKTDVYAGKVRDLLTGLGIQGERVTIFYASFGVYGELPVIFVPLPDCYVLVDPTNGNISGPFTRTSKINAGGLLAAHTEAFSTSMSIRYYSASGCIFKDPPGWKTEPPCGNIFNPCTPPIYWDPADPDGNQWFCFSQGIDGDGNLACVCERRGTTPIGTPAINVPVRRACNCGFPGAGCANGSQPGYPPLGCPPPSTCPVQYWW